MNVVQTKLPQKSLDYLQDLIQANIDSRDGLREAAKHLTPTSDGPLYQLFYSLADERAAQASELQAILACNDERPATSGSVTAMAHRAWTDFREAIGGGEKALLEEAERGEDQIKAAYETAIVDLGTCECVETLRKHYAAVKAAHDRIRDLRDRCTA